MHDTTNSFSKYFFWNGNGNVNLCTFLERSNGQTEEFINLDILSSTLQLHGYKVSCKLSISISYNIGMSKYLRDINPSFSSLGGKVSVPTLVCQHFIFIEYWFSLRLGLNLFHFILFPDSDMYVNSPLSLSLSLSLWETLLRFAHP